MPEPARLRPLLFVVMPFGLKPDATGQHTIDFDRIYAEAIKPAAETADLEVIRADEERSGGIIHVPMFERLLLAEIVVADLTTPNPNVFYELGVRHCARPRSTILIYATGNQLPFDVRMIRALPYDLEDGILAGPAASALRSALEQKLRAARTAVEENDSPLFQLIPHFPGVTLPPERTVEFRGHARYRQGLRDRLADARRLLAVPQARPDARDAARSQAVTKIRGVEEALGDLVSASAELVVDVLLSYRDATAHDEIISLVERLPAGPLPAAVSAPRTAAAPQALTDTVTIREVYGFALNRRAGQHADPSARRRDRQQAAEVLEAIITRHGSSPETCGLLGRVYKDRYSDALTEGRWAQAAAFLDEAMAWYRRGFEADPRDFYPGINLVTLLFVKGDSEALTELRTILPAVAFAVARRGGIGSRDYWEVATVLEAAVLGEDWAVATRAAARLLILDAPGWNRQSTVDNLRLIRDVRATRGLATDELDGILRQLEGDP